MKTENVKTSDLCLLFRVPREEIMFEQSHRAFLEFPLAVENFQLTAKLASFATGLATDCRSNFLQFFNLPTCKSASINIDFRVPIIVKIDSKSNGTWKVFLVFISAFPTRSQTARRIFDIADTDGGNRLETRLRRMSTCSLFPSPWCCKIYVERNVACLKSFDAKSFPFSVYTITIGFAWLAFVATKIEV